MQDANKPYVVIVGIDYSSLGDLALEHAFEMASDHPNAEVHIVHVVRTFGPLVQFEVPNDPRGAQTMSLAEASEQLRGYSDTKLAAFKERRQKAGAALFQRATSHLRLDAPAEEIAQLAADLEADLVVLGTHGRRGVQRLLLGSVAEAVVRMAPCPVLVVRPKEIPSVPQIQPPCPRCVETRRTSGGKDMWCEQHSERHGQRHTYHQGDRMSGGGKMPLVF